VKRGREVTLFSRHEKVLNRRFPGVVDAYESAEPCGCPGNVPKSPVIFCFWHNRILSITLTFIRHYPLLQNSLSQERPIYFYAFDLLKRDGEISVNLPFSRRRELLENLLGVPEEPLRLSPLLRAPSGQVLEAVRKLGLEGVVGKRSGSLYEPGKRSGAWIKHRTNLE
jgi:bifunctional non-homologous end joining protein LigD